MRVHAKPLALGVMGKLGVGGRKALVGGDWRTLVWGTWRHTEPRIWGQVMLQGIPEVEGDGRVEGACGGMWGAVHPWGVQCTRATQATKCATC